MDAISVEETAVVNVRRCIGCGLCVTACEYDSISLYPKDDDNKWVPPDNTIKTYLTIAKEKGLI